MKSKARTLIGYWKPINEQRRDPLLTDLYQAAIALLRMMIAACEEHGVVIDNEENIRNAVTLCDAKSKGDHVDKSYLKEVYDNLSCVIYGVSDYSYIEKATYETLNLVFGSEVAPYVNYRVILPRISSTANDLLKSLGYDERINKMYLSEQMVIEILNKNIRRR